MYTVRSSAHLNTVLLFSLLALPIVYAFTPDAVASQGACHDAVQGKIAWDYKGSKQWSGKNIASLCKGAENSTQPARCFDRVMHDGVNWGGSTKWKWKNALNLCQGTQNAQARVTCFTDKIDEGTGWSSAISACKRSRDKSREATVAVPKKAPANVKSRGELTQAPEARPSGSESEPQLNLNTEAVRKAITEQAAQKNEGRKPDRPRCSQVSLRRNHIKLDRAAAGGHVVRLEGCLGQPDPDDVQIWIRIGDHIEKQRARFYRTYATVAAPEFVFRGGAEATLVRTRGDETYQLTPWVEIARVEGDKDGDGHFATKWGGDDCDDSDVNRFPGNAEVADPTHDEDCDPTTIDSGTRLHAASGDGDKDRDTFIDENVGNYGGGHHIPDSANYHIGRRDGKAFVYGTDCDDTRPDVHPQQIEVCNGRDDNCNGEIDEGLRNCPQQ